MSHQSFSYHSSSVARNLFWNLRTHRDNNVLLTFPKQFQRKYACANEKFGGSLKRFSCNTSAMCQPEMPKGKQQRVPLVALLWFSYRPPLFKWHTMLLLILEDFQLYFSRERNSENSCEGPSTSSFVLPAANFKQAEWVVYAVTGYFPEGIQCLQRWLLLASYHGCELIYRSTCLHHALKVTVVKDAMLS